jgi:hypothetical protein
MPVNLQDAAPRTAFPFAGQIALAAAENRFDAEAGRPAASPAGDVDWTAICIRRQLI